MRKRVLSAVVAFGILMCTFVFPSSESNALENDEKYRFYGNMNIDPSGHYKYVVPNLFIQDASYTNVKSFPLVVSGGGEYVPLDLFARFSYIKIVYSKITDGFYLNNTKNNHYVAFDMSTDTTTTHDAQMVEIAARIYNRTYYVPADEVCAILGLGFDTYDDMEKGVRAVRIYDSKAKLTMEELIERYSPKPKEPAADSSETTNPSESTETTDGENGSSEVAAPNTGVSSNDTSTDKTGTSGSEDTDKTTDNKDNPDADKSSTSHESSGNKNTYSPSTSDSPSNVKPTANTSKNNTSTAANSSAPSTGSTGTSTPSAPATTPVQGSADNTTNVPASPNTSATASSSTHGGSNVPASTAPSTPSTTPSTPNTGAHTAAPSTPVTAAPSTTPSKPLSAATNTGTTAANVPTINNPTNSSVQSNPTVSDNTPVTPPEPVDPLKQVAARNMYITFDVTDDENAADILDLLSKNGINAVFFVDKDIIFAMPDIIRRMLAEGHSVGIGFDVSSGDGGVLDNDAILEQINEANRALYLVAKTKTRYIRAVYSNVNGAADKLEENGFAEFITENGFEICDWSIDSGDADRYRASQLESLKNSLAGNNTRSEKSLFVRFGTKNGTSQLFDALIAFTKNYPQFKFMTTDEYTGKVSFIGK